MKGKSKIIVLKRKTNEEKLETIRKRTRRDLAKKNLNKKLSPKHQKPKEVKTKKKKPIRLQRKLTGMIYGEILVSISPSMKKYNNYKIPQ